MIKPFRDLAAGVIKTRGFLPTSFTKMDRRDASTAIRQHVATAATERGRRTQRPSCGVQTRIKVNYSLIHWIPSCVVRVRGGSSLLPLGFLLCYTENMRKPIKVTPKKKRGRPATGRDPHVTSRMPAVLIAEVEAWAAANDTSRSDAFRRLVELGLTVRTKSKQAPAARAARVKELASSAIDTMSDPSAPAEEHAQRRRRLTKGPEEFREARVDRPEAKGK